MERQSLSDVMFLKAGRAFGQQPQSLLLCLRYQESQSAGVSFRAAAATYVTALAAGTWICLAEPAKIFRAVFDYNDDEIAE